MRINEAIVLAAGASKRLGSPKALVEVKGQTLVELVCGKLQNAGLSVTVVTRNSLKQEIQKFLPNISVVVNPNPDLGRTGTCLLYTSPSPRDAHESRMPSSA